MLSLYRNRVLAVACVLLAGLVAYSSAQTITINRSTEYQIVDGLGGFACLKAAKTRQGPFYIDAPMEPHYDSLCFDLGVSLVRFEVAGSYQTSAGGAYDVNGSVFCGPTMMGNINMIREFAARGVNRFLFTVWSPPGYMKPIGITSCINEAAPDYNTTQCKLDPANYTAFGNFLNAYLKAIQDSTGIVPYALSLQNEPRFSQPFNSCVYNSEAYRNVHRTVCPIVFGQFPNIRFVGNEDLTGWHFNQWMNAFMNDNTVKPHLYALASHYANAGGFQEVWNIASQHGKRVWGTEEQHTDGLLSQAQLIHGGLVSGNASSWIIWVLESLFDGGGDGNSRMPRPSYAAAKHYFRFIRPNAIRVAASGGSASLLVSAFKHNTDNTTTVVMINTAGSSTSVTVTGSDLPGTFHIYRSAGTTLCENIGTTAPNTTINLPANSITTLHNLEITSVQKPAPTPLGGTQVYRQAIPANARTYTLDGKLLDVSAHRRAVSGVRVIVDGQQVRRSAIGTMR